MEKISKALLVKNITVVFITTMIIALLIWFSPHDYSDYDALNRNLDGTIRLLLNGRLGYLFNLNYVGISALACLILIPQIYFSKGKTMAKYTLLLFILMFVTGLFLSFFAYINYRYISTLIPVAIGLLLIFTDVLFKQKDQNLWLWTLLIIQCSIFLATIVFSFVPKYIGRISKTDEKSQISSSISCPNIYHYINDSLELRHKVLINNLPEFFLRTKHQGVFYWSGDDEYFNKTGAHSLLKNKSSEQVMHMLKDSLKVDFILTNKQLTPYNPQFNLLLQGHFQLYKADNSGNELYKLL